ncbi:MAG TPA: hypothetical protein VMW42_06945 [Desulfatiglandales bacterium]|nr:hypothetical protein [Desulfatiglandales bacterium]
MVKSLISYQAMPISSRRYLSTYGYVVKYSGFADKVVDSYGLSKINPKYLTTTESCGISF